MENKWLSTQFFSHYPIPSEELKQFLENLQLSKVEVSHAHCAWEIYFFCQQVPSEQILEQCNQYLGRVFTGINHISLIPQLTGNVDVPEFLAKNWWLVKGLLERNYPSVRGWFINSYWKYEESILSIFLGSELGIKYLEKHRCSQFTQDLLQTMIGFTGTVSLSHDGQIQLPEIKTAEPMKYVAPAIEKAAPVAKGMDQGDKPIEGPVILGKVIKDEPRAMDECTEEENYVTIQGKVFSTEAKELKSGRGILTFDMTDLTDSLTCKIIKDYSEIEKIAERVKKGETIRVKGSIKIDKFSQELVMMAYDINEAEKPRKIDANPDKRIELHLHTKMSSMDGVSSIKELVALAGSYGHPALAITDHGVVQSFPDAYDLGKKHNVKIIYGMEGYIYDDTIPEASKPRTYHCVILAKDMVGLKNLYKLVTESHLRYFKRRPRIPKRLLEEMREGLVIGSACEAGELIQAYVEDPHNVDRLKSVAEFYDYIEIQPHKNNEFMLRSEKFPQFNREEDLIKINKTLYQLGKEMGKLVVATGDVHFASEDDAIYRAILMAGKGFADADKQAPLYYRTTDEMLAEFEYLGPDIAREVVIDNPKEVIKDFDEIKPIPDELYSPEIPGAEEDIINLTNNRAHELYGPELPEVVQARIKKELDSIINNGFAVLYLIAHKLVKKSNDDGYLVGSRGSVGSSFVATMTGITEVNPLPPHYYCMDCYVSEFITDGSYGSGADLPDKNCPKCGKPYIKDGHDIPFEVFLGFKGDKVPDIDLNFSGDYQPRAHKYTEELFGKDNVFRAGTISTIAEKTAFGYVKKYYDSKGQYKKQAELSRLSCGCSGVKKTTGQHPGGLMVVPKGIDVHDFTPLQRPADDVKTETITTHFDYHSISSRLVKLDILGHDDPTVIKMLEDLTGYDAKTIPLDHPETMALFSGTESLGIKEDELRSTVGTYGIPEFGTKFVRQMLEDTKPKTFSELVRISGFSHGTDVWLNNAQDLIKAGIAQLSEAISARDDIMVYLIHKGLEPSRAFKIMEGVRKGKGVKPEDEEYMRENNVPDWYIESCQKIKYMFPKAHAVAYVMMAFRIAFFKIKFPLAFYATFFTVRADEFDVVTISKGLYDIQRVMDDIQEKGNFASNKEVKSLITLELALEMYLRGFHVTRIDLWKSHATHFLIEGDHLIPPFSSLEGVGETVAENIVAARNEAVFTSIDDVRIRGKASKSVIEALQQHGVFEGLPESDQLALFN